MLLIEEEVAKHHASVAIYAPSVRALEKNSELVNKLPVKTELKPRGSWESSEPVPLARKETTYLFENIESNLLKPDEEKIKTMFKYFKIFLSF